MAKLSTSFNLGLWNNFASTFAADFRFGPLNIITLLAMSVMALITHNLIYDFDIDIVIMLMISAMVLAVLFRLSQIWEVVLLFTSIAALVAYHRYGSESHIIVCSLVTMGLLSPCVQMA